MIDDRKKIVEKFWQQIVVDITETLEEKDEVYTELLDENERASVLVGSAWLEECLSVLIRLILPDDKKVADYFLKRILPFNTRINAARTLRLISRVEKNRLGIIGEIRNKFAHRVTTSFDDPKIAKLIAKLEPIQLRSDRIPVDLPSLNNPQERYASMVTILYFLIYGRISTAQELNDVASRLEKLRAITEYIDEES